MTASTPRFKRRTLVLGAMSLGLIGRFASAAPERSIRLSAAPGMAPLVVPDGPPTQTWLFNGTAPGPVLRAKQGDTLVVDVENRLPEPTTVHWHGLRVPVEQDGVPHFSQSPIKPGESFTYELPLHDAGTFWYHPHINSSEQIGRGLHGFLIVDEPPEIAARLAADREIIWALDDWRLDQHAQIMPFKNRHSMSHGGRLGNVLTVNGSHVTRTEARSGERIRLRLCNMANARSFRLLFAPLDPWVIALDGHPVPPRRLGESGLWLGSGQRADLILDVDLSPGEQARGIDDAFGPDQAIEVMTWNVSGAAPLRETPLPPPEALPSNPVVKPDLSNAMTHPIVFEGGAMDSMSGAMMNGQMLTMRQVAAAGKFWAINGEIPSGYQNMRPLLSLQRNRTHIIQLENRTQWPHPIHLHGHSFEVNDPRYFSGETTVIRDTVLLAPDEQVEIAFVADNPGTWMLHCHVLEHQASGMMGVVEVT
ncbi:MAG: multicopper oxidase family protein [Pseudomonadota bacterium]